MKSIVLFFLLSCCWTNTVPMLQAQSAAADSLTIFQQLAQEPKLQIQLKTNLKTLIKKKAKKENHTALLSYTNQAGKEEMWNIKVRARGNMRNKICFFPPLKIDFSKSDLRQAGIKGDYDDLKLVVHCKGGGLYDDLVLREYLAYKLYNELTDISFKVHLVQLTLVDTEGKQKNIETYGFLIENDDEMAARLNGRVLSTKFIKQATLHPTLFDQFCLFQYLIGNTDWYILNKHNIKALRVGEYKQPIAVPYDFDYSGMVNAPYATPNRLLPQENLLDRFYLGLCRTEAELAPSFQVFKDKKADLFKVISSLSDLSDKSKKDIIGFVEKFYKIIESPKSCKRQIVEHCDRYVKVK